MTQTNGKASLKDVYAVVNRLEDKVDNILREHATKIDRLEDGQAKMFGGLALLSVAWTWIINQLMK